MRKLLSAIIPILVSTHPHVALASDYQSLPAAEKHSFLMQKIKDSEYKTLPRFSGFEVLPLLELALPWNKQKAKEYMSVTVKRDEDVLPQGRKKVVHTYGSVAGVSFIAAEGSPHTGLFKGSKYGLVRLSLAMKPNVITMPGAAFKFLVDGQPSKNFVAMNSLTGQASYNFFEKEFSNVLPTINSPIAKPLQDVFASVTRFPTSVSVEHLAEVDEKGISEDPLLVSAPSKLVFVPNPNLNFAKTPHEFRKDLASIAKGSWLYRVFSEEEGQRQFIGYVVTTTPFIASAFGDEQLFFNHQTVDAK